MAAEEFFARWSRKKQEETSGTTIEPPSEQVTGAPHEQVATVASPDVPQSLPTQQDVEKLTPDSDYSVFMAQGVDESVRRSAMKKLFSDPHFNIMDGLDVYIEDFSKFEPITPALLASLNHAKNLLDPLSQLETPLMRLLDMADKEKEGNQETDIKEIEQEDRESTNDAGSAESEDSNQSVVHNETDEQNEHDATENNKSDVARNVNDV
jgi:hypothetical protein